MTKPIHTIREDDPRRASPRAVRASSALLPLIVVIVLLIVVGRRQADKQRLPTPPEQPSEDAERAERQRDLERVREDLRRNLPPAPNGLTRYEEIAQ